MHLIGKIYTWVLEATRLSQDSMLIDHSSLLDPMNHEPLHQLSCFEWVDILESVASCPLQLTTAKKPGCEYAT